MSSPAYATVDEYRAYTGDSTSENERIKAVLEQQSAKLRAECGLNVSDVLVDDTETLAKLLVTDAARKMLVPVSVDGISDITGASSASFTANGFQSSVTLSNPSGAAYFDRNTLKAFKRALGIEQRIGYVWPRGLLMFGEVVSVWRKTQTGTDAMGEPIYEWTSEDVANCLIRPLSGEDISEAARPDGVRASYSVAFPKTYLDRDSLRGCKVSFRDLGEDEALDVVGEPDITRPCPTAWDVIAQVGRADG